MPDQPFVSVIIPVRNDAARLHRCVEMLERQTYPADRFEVVVVDNDSEVPVAADFGRYPHVRIASEPSGGSYAARNRGIELGSGEALAFTDSDAVPRRDWIEKGVECLIAEGPNAVVGGAIDVFCERPDHPTSAELYEMAVAFPQQRYVERAHFAVTANLWVWRELARRVGPFDARLLSGGDTDWGNRAYAAGARLVFRPEVVVGHPARRRMRDLVSKAIRVGVGTHDRGLNGIIGLARAAAPPLPELRRIFTAPRLQSRSQRLRASAVAVALRYVRLGVRLLLLVGMKSRWRHIQ